MRVQSKLTPNFLQDSVEIAMFSWVNVAGWALSRIAAFSAFRPNESNPIGFRTS